MSICASTCFPAAPLIQTPLRCEVVYRSECVKRPVFIKCSFALPAAATPAAWCTTLNTGITGGNIIATGQAADMGWAAPETTEFTLGCGLPVPQVVSRTLSLKDYNTYETTFSNAASPMHERDIWRQIKQSPNGWNIGWVSCQGDFYIAHDTNYAVAAAYTYRYQAIVSVVSNIDKEKLPGQCMEFKEVNIKFNFDPLADMSKPTITNIAATCAATPTVVNALV